MYLRRTKVHKTPPKPMLLLSLFIAFLGFAVCNAAVADRKISIHPIYWEHWITASGAIAAPNSAYLIKTIIVLKNPSTVEQEVTVLASPSYFSLHSPTLSCGEYKFSIDGTFATASPVTTGSSKSTMVRVPAGELKRVNVGAWYRSGASGSNPACSFPGAYHLAGAFSIELSVHSANDAGYLTGFVHTNDNNNHFILIDDNTFGYGKSDPTSIPILGGRPF